MSYGRSLMVEPGIAGLGDQGNSLKEMTVKNR